MASYLKYQPDNLGDVILPVALRGVLETMIEDDCMEPMIFYGAPGTGKSLTARLLTENHVLFRCDGVESATRILEQAWSAATSYNLLHLYSRRLIILDEIDRFSIPMQEKVRALIDQTSQVSSLIATTNHIDQVIPALRSRMLPFCFDVDKGDVVMISTWKRRLKSIYQERFGEEAEEPRLENALRHFPDGRRMVSTLMTGLTM